LLLKRYFGLNIVRFMALVRRILLLFLFISFPRLLRADETAPDSPFVPPLWNVHFQTTFVPEYHGSFYALYPGNPGAGSLIDSPELDMSNTWTLFLGGRLWKDGALYVDFEGAAGSGFSNVTGIAGFPNGEIYRVSNPGEKVILARAYWKQVFGLGGEQEAVPDDQNQLKEKIDISRFTLVAGKFSIVDFFDDNAYSHDARSQFLNWALQDNGAWDYAADLQGYTWGLYLEFNQKDWALRVCSALVSQVANGAVLDTDLTHYNGNQAEFEARYDLAAHPGKVRLQAYLNDADMGNYAEAVSLGAATGTIPEVTQTRSYSDKYGFGLDAEQELGQDLGAFARLGWDNGLTETWEYTAIDRTAQAGFLLSGNRWGRPDDQLGLGAVINGLSAQHEAYLAAGGVDFIIGDGRLDYAPEKILEAFYNYHPIREIGLTLDFQWVTNPAYNQDRGPVGIVSGRAHLEI
jgi:high affinity Mn2+ porin